MRNNKDELKEWADCMEQGERKDDLLMIAARLEQLEDGDLPSVEFQRQLRRDLLNQYPAATRSPQRVWQRVGSLASLGILAALVFAIWLSIGSAGRNAPGGAPVNGEPLASATSRITGLVHSGYTLLDYSVSGGIVTEMTETDGGEDQTDFLLVPGMTAEITTRWKMTVDTVESPRFTLHLLDSDGRMIVQSDAMIKATGGLDDSMGESVLTLAIPADLPPGEYDLEGGLFDATTGDRLAFNSLQGEVMERMRADFIVGSSNNSAFTVTNGASNGLESEATTFGLLGPNRLVVRDVSPASGTVISGTTPVDFTITVDYALGSLPEANLEVRVTALQGESGQSGRGVGLAVSPIVQGSGTVTVVVTVNPDELLDPTDLGLWLQIKPGDVRSAPIVMEMPTEYRWQYQP